MEIVNQKEIRIFGIKRSGNHAIINWIFQQIPNQAVFLNNCYQAGKKLKLYEGIGTINCKGIDYWDFKKRFLLFEKNPFQGKNIIAYSREDKRFNNQKLKNYPKEGLIISFEGKDINKMMTALDHNHDQLVGSSAKIFSFIIIRDPFNLFASIYKKWGKKYLLRFIPLWKQYANLVVNSKANFDSILYNQWLTDQNYRKSITKKLQIPFDDSGKDVVANFGGGSSFDGASNQVKAKDLQVLSRWQFFQDDQDFHSCFQDAEIIELSEKIFGVIPGTQDLLNKL